MRNHIFVVSSYLFVCLSSLGRFSDFPWVKRGPGCLFYGKDSFKGFPVPWVGTGEGQAVGKSQRKTREAGLKKDRWKKKDGKEKL